MVGGGERGGDGSRGGRKEVEVEGRKRGGKREKGGGEADERKGKHVSDSESN